MKRATVCDKRKSAKPGEDLSVTVLPERKWGRPPLLGEKLDTYLKSYITAMRSRATPVRSNIVIGVARGILLKHNRSVQVVSSIFDPLGYFSPTILLAKLYIKMLWTERYDLNNKLMTNK